MAKRGKPSAPPGRSNRSALLLFVLIVIGAGGAGYWFGTRQESAPEPPRDTIKITTPKHDPAQNDVVPEVRDVPIDPKKEPIRQAVEAQLATADGKRNSAFPKGTRLVSLNVKDGTAIVELSPEFNEVNSGGDSGESLAYNALRDVLAQFRTVKYMRVLVDGKVFEGEHSGAWAEVEVRDGNARAEGRP
jgi:hypothetical protein